MNTLHPNTVALTLRILAFAMNLPTPMQCFVQYSPHVQTLDLRFFREGWKRDTRETPSWETYVRLDQADENLWPQLEELLKRMENECVGVIHEVHSRLADVAACAA